MHPAICQQSPQTALLIVDVQAVFAPHTFKYADMLKNCLALAQIFDILQMPVIVTEQYPEKLGPTDKALIAALKNFAPLSKVSCSACGSPPFMEKLIRDKIRTVVLCGLEAHICVSQTAHDLLENGIHVHLVEDAVSAHTSENRRIGIEKIVASGAIRSSTETVAYELIKTKDHPSFKAVHRFFTNN